MMDTKIRVAVIDEYPLFREGMVSALEEHADIEVVARGETIQDAIRIAREYEPHVVALDVTLLDNALASISDILLQYPAASILAVAMTASEEQVSSALQRGVRGYLMKKASTYELVQTVRALKRGEYYVSPSVAARLLMRADAGATKADSSLSRVAELTLREEEILSILVQGCSNKEIGNKLALSEKTIKHHVTNILQKLQVRNRVEAALLAAGRMPAGAPVRQ
jgi:two-component system, NarL family, nitrate/nitrite response regulator NarL